MPVKPISFSPPMVHSIFKGNKDSTRRVILPENVFADGTAKVPYAVGDVLYVRERHYTYGQWLIDPDKPQDGPRPRIYFKPLATPQYDPPRYPDTAPFRPDPHDLHRKGIFARPPMFHLKAEARLFLRVLKAHAEPLDAITDFEATREGIVGASKDGKWRKFGLLDRDGMPGTDDMGWHWQDFQKTPRLAFVRLWEILHGAGSFALNPMVSVTQFEEISRADFNKANS